MSTAAGLIVPFAVLGLFAIAVPLVMMRLLPRTLRACLANLALSVVAMFFIGMLLLVLLYGSQLPELAGDIAADPLGGAVWLARLGAIPALAWGPILLLTELIIAQRIAGEA